MVHTHRRSDDNGQNPRQRNHGGATRPRPQSYQSRKGDPQSAGIRSARSTSAKAPEEMRQRLQRNNRPVSKTDGFFRPAPSETRPRRRSASVTKQTPNSVRTRSYEDAADRAV